MPCAACVIVAASAVGTCEAARCSLLMRSALERSVLQQVADAAPARDGILEAAADQLVRVVAKIAARDIDDVLHVCDAVAAGCHADIQRWCDDRVIGCGEVTCRTKVDAVNTGVVDVAAPTDAVAALAGKVVKRVTNAFACVIERAVDLDSGGLEIRGQPGECGMDSGVEDGLGQNGRIDGNRIIPDLAGVGVRQPRGKAVESDCRRYRRVIQEAALGDVSPVLVEVVVVHIDTIAGRAVADCGGCEVALTEPAVAIVLPRRLPPRALRQSLPVAQRIEEQYAQSGAGLVAREER